ncbi:MAG TPA: outer membrane protein assembly factor BamD [Anaeromyxobacteraceae bacterium]|nr:outer membrane protein assembly factor BamD [Anaeromyxobacteraceae bacterium]
MTFRRPIMWPLVAVLALGACARSAPAVKYESQAEEDYTVGVAELEDRNFGDAQRLLERVRTKYPYSKYGALAELRLADLRYDQGKYIEAAEAYQTFVKIHPSSPEVDYAAYRAALSRWNDAPTDFFLFPPVYERDLTQVVKASDGLAQFVEKFPNSKYAPDAKEKLAKSRDILAERDWYVFDFNKKREKWQGAAFRLEKLLKDYPGSTREPEALWQLADMYVKLSERFKAQKVLQQIIVKYPASSQRAGAEKLLAELRKQPEPAPSPWK